MIKQTKRGNVIHISSSFYDDMKLMKRSEYDTDYRDLRYNSNMDVEKLKLSYVVQKIILWKKGTQEISQWAMQQPNDYFTRNNVKLDYIGEDWVPYEEDIDLEKATKKD